MWTCQDQNRGEGAMRGTLQGVPHVKICFVLWMRKCICPCFRHPLCVTHTLTLNKPSLAQEPGQAWQGLYRHPPFYPQHSDSPSTRICNRLKLLGRQTFERPSVPLPRLKMSCRSEEIKLGIFFLSLCPLGLFEFNTQRVKKRTEERRNPFRNVGKELGVFRLCVDILFTAWTK